MENIMQSKAVCKAKDFVKSLGDIRLKKDYSLSISVYNANDADSEKCAHTFKGSSDHGLVKMMAAAGVASVFASAVCALCSLMHRK